ncbi:HYR domain-containing protein, partial [Flavobacterium frigoris]|uniref:HYR domain-containing protein n=1 Tax=Flavobacterium frigoris TaxID=229204 RepID=UPI00058D8057
MAKKYFFIPLLFISFLFSYGQSSTGDFQSNTSITSDWSSNTSWETYDGSNWIVASTYPGENPGTYTVTIQSGHEIIISSNLSTTSMGHVIVKGTLNLNPNTLPNTINLNTTSLNIDEGSLKFSSNKVRLNLPSAAIITLENNGNFAGSCTITDEIYIDTRLYPTCLTGASKIYTLGEILPSAGNVNVNITDPATDPVNSSTCTTINLTGGYSGTDTGVTYKWILRDPNGLNTTIISGSLDSSAKTTSTSFTPSTIGQYLVSLEVTTATLATNIETRTFNITDTSNPVLTPEANQEVILSGSCTATIPNLVDGSSATDNCAGITISQTPLAGATQAAVHNETINVTVTATDAAGNTDSKVVVITVLDNITPTISCPSNLNLNVGTGTCTASVATISPTTADNCSVTKLTWTLAGATTAASAATGINNLGTQIFNLGITTVNYRVEDAAGNFATCSYTVTVSDNQVPDISCPIATNADRNVNTADCTYTAVGTEFNATATDNCAVTSLTYELSGATSGTGTSLNGIVFNKGITTVTWSVTDGINATINCDFTVTVVDSQNPTIATLTAINVNADSGLCTYASSQLTKPTALD